MTQIEYKAGPTAAGPMRNYTIPGKFTDLKSVLFKRETGEVEGYKQYVALDDIVYDLYQPCNGTEY